MTEVVQRCGELRARLVELAEHELHAFEPVLDAIRLPRAQPGRDARVAAALSEAAESPLDIARAAGEVAELAAELAVSGARRLVGDAVTAALLAEASCVAAGRLVEINLESVADEPRRSEVSDLAAAAAGARERALSPQQS
jgi:formiminotetrahydrofolate cyclodeaminase